MCHNTHYLPSLSFIHTDFHIWYLYLLYRKCWDRKISRKFWTWIKTISTFAITSKDARWKMRLETWNISQLDFMICNSLKMKTYHILCKVFKTCSVIHWTSRLICVGLSGAKKNNREKKRERRKEGKSQKEKWQKKTGWWNDATPNSCSKSQGSGKQESCPRRPLVTRHGLCLH